MRVCLLLALRYLRTRRIAVVGGATVAVGVMALVVLTSLWDGVLKFSEDHLRTSVADIQVRPGSRAVQKRLWSVVLGSVGEDPDVVAVAPRDIGPALLAPGKNPGPEIEERIRPCQILGVDAELDAKVVPWHRMLAAIQDRTLQVPEERRANPLQSEEGELPWILLGDTLAKRLGVSRTGAPGVPSTVTVVTPSNVAGENPSPSLDDQLHRLFRVAGCFSMGHSDYDDVTAVIDRRVLQRLRYGERPPIEASQVLLKLRAGSDAAQVAERLNAEHPYLDCISWEAFSQFRALNDQKRIWVLILSLVVIVACAAICGLIYMMVLEKTRDIGILMSLGLSRARVVASFTLYGFVISACGLLVGLLIGLWITRNLDSVVGKLSDWFGVELLNSEIYKFRSVPVQVDAGNLSAICFGVLGACLLASFIPALRASIMRPVRCLRGH